MKLLAKTAEERYQTAAGLESDLRHCLADWERQGRIDPFALGEHDAPDRLLIPEKLYGRTREVDTLLASFDRIVKSGAPELVLVSGYSGIGKSSVVNELLPSGCAASPCGPPRWHKWCTRRRAVVHFLPFSLFLRWPRKGYSLSITAMRDGLGT